MSTHSTSRDGFLPVADGLMASSLGTLAEASMLQSQSEAVENNSAAGSSSIRQGSTGSLSQTRTDNVLPSLAAGGMTQSLGDMGLGNPSDLIRATDNVSPYGSQSFQDLIDIDPNLGASLGGHGMGNAAGDGDAGYLQNFDYFNLMEVCGDINMNEASPTPDPAGSIPVERFDKVARLWPNPGGKCMADDEATRLWTDVVAHKGDNILADTSVAGASPVPSVGRESGSSWGLDDDGRLDMIRELRQSLPGFDTIADRFPPTRLLNVSLDAVFRQSSSLLQCIHRPTFSAKTAPPLVTLSACLLGLVILDHADIRPLALLYLPVRPSASIHSDCVVS